MRERGVHLTYTGATHRAPAPDREWDMQQAPQRTEYELTDRPRTDRSRGGLLRRFLFADEEPGIRAAPPRPAEAPPSMVVQPVIEPHLATVYLKVQRLETGMRLVADTLKKSYGELATEMRSLGDRLDQPRAEPTSPGPAAAIDDKALESLNASVQRLTETVLALSLVLGSATERLGERIEAARMDIEDNVIAILRRPSESELPPFFADEASSPWARDAQAAANG